MRDCGLRDWKSEMSLDAPPLPPNATNASRQRYEIAARLAESCPPELGDEVALTGSTARGLADEDSDLELNLWGEQIPSAEARTAWLAAAGVEAIEVFEHPRPDASYWIGGRYGDVPLEIGWQTYATIEATVSDLLAGRAALALGDILINAIPFRSGGRLAQWQARLAGYSDVVQAQIVEKAVAQWTGEGSTQALASIARRGERLLLAERLTSNLNTAMALLYAVNRRWQPSRKWTLRRAQELPMMPEQWRDRIDAVLSAPPDDAVRLYATFALDTLALVPPDYDVSAAVEMMGDGG